MAAAAMRLLRTPGTARALAARARAECLARYVWPAVAQEWEALYVRLAREAPAPRPAGLGVRAGELPRT
jgi:hypothetical protein